MSHQTLWAENGNGRLRSPLNGMEQIGGECQKPSLATAQPLLQEERSVIGVDSHPQSIIVPTREAGTRSYLSGDSSSSSYIRVK
ncbi:hypothetical protein AVEN_187625-1 [Araneus ventricosus]|uniref:Uncharacterized protein n=1 Tax=Araneus ventricosus TaxID=182803 RepID=A0A4Y2MZC3_ARAVE|nr:hypothetical protein AVEN_187625-1 [Araneus ventricosus]